MSVTLQAVVALDNRNFTSGLNALHATTMRVTQAMMAAFGGLGGEILALTKAFGLVGASVGILKEASYSGAEFQKAMAGLKAETGLTGHALETLGEYAKDLSLRLPASAEESVKAMRALHAAGAETADEIKSALIPALQIASLAEADVAKIADELVKTLHNFGKGAQDTAQYSRQMAAATSPQHMAGFSEAMLAASQTANALGISIEETAAVLSTFEASGIEGAVAGKQFSMVLDKMSDAARKMDSDLGRALAGWKPATEGFSGALARIQNSGLSMEKVFEELGPRTAKSLISLAASGGTALNDLTARIQSGVDITETYNAKNDTLIAKTSELKNAFGVLMDDVFKPISTALGRLIDDIKGVVTWIDRLVKLITSGNWAGAWMTFRAEAVRAFEFVKTQALGLAERIRSGILDTDWGKVWDGLKTGFIGAVNFIYGLRTAITDGLQQALTGVNAESMRKAFSEVADAFRQIIPTIEQSFVSLWGLIQEGARVTWLAIQEGWSRLVAWIGSTPIPAQWESLVAGLTGAVAAARERVTVAFAGILDDIRGMIDRLPESMKSGFAALAGSLQTFGTTAMGLIQQVVDLFGTLTSSIVTAGDRSGILSNIPRWLGEIADIASHVINAMTWVAQAVGRIVEVLTTVAGSDEALWALEAVFWAVREAVDGTLAVVHLFATGLENLAGLIATIPGPILHIAAAIAGTAGLSWALGLAETRVIALIAQLRIFVAVQLFQLRTMLPQLIGQMGAFAGSLGAVGQAGLVAGAAVAGWELGKLIRDLPGVAQWCDNLAESIFKLTGMMVEEDPALEARVKRLRAQREEMERARAAEMGMAHTMGKLEEATDSADESLADSTHTLGTLDEAVTAVGKHTELTAHTAGRLEEAVAGIGNEASGAAHTLGKLEEAVDTVTAVTAKAEAPLQQLRGALQSLSFQMKIDVPQLTEYQVAMWDKFKSVFAALKALNFEMKIELPHMTQYQVDRWWEMTRVFAALKALKFEMTISLPHLTEFQVKLWNQMTGVFANLKALNFNMKIELPHLTEQQVKLWGKFMDVIQGKGGNLKAPQVPDIGGNLKRIADSLDSLVAMKGIIWA